MGLMDLSSGLICRERAFQHAGFGGCGVHVVFEDVPAGENQVVKPRQRHEFFDFRASGIGTFSQADSSHLGE